MTDLSQSASGYGALPTDQQDSPPMKEKAAESADAAKQAAGDVAGTATEKAKDVAGEAKRQARDLVSEARDQVGGQVGNQHQNLVSNLHSLADELSRMSGASEQQGLASELVGQAGDRARGAANWLGDRQPGDLLDEVRSFARRRPGTFLIGSLVAGVAVGRLTRGVVAVHKDESSDDTLAVNPNATGYSSPPAYQGVPTSQGGSAYADAPTTEFASSSEITSGMPSPGVTPGVTPPGTSFRPPEPPPAPAGPGVGSV